MKSMFVKLLAQKHQPGLLGSNNQLPATWMGPSLSYPFLTSLGLGLAYELEEVDSDSSVTFFSRSLSL
nr:hypothetical protein Q903MT_gene5065 [Picea sitchensis]